MAANQPRNAVGLWTLLEEIAELSAESRPSLVFHLRSGRDVPGQLVNARSADSSGDKNVLITVEGGWMFLPFHAIEAISVLDGGPRAATVPVVVPHDRSITQMQKDLRARVHPGIFCELDLGGRTLGPDERRMVQRMVEDATAVLTGLADDENRKPALQNVRIVRLSLGDSPSVTRERDVLTLVAPRSEARAFTRGELQRSIESAIAD